MSDPKVVVGYWKIRGLAAPLRMILEYKGIEYENVLYEAHGSPGNWDVSSWFKEDKPKLLKENALMNLPYIQYDDVVVTQSNACLRFLGRKLDLNGKNEKEITNNDQVMDFRNDAVHLFYSPRFNDDKDKYVTGSMPRHMKKLDEWLSQQKTKFLAADEPTVCDFHLWEILDQHEEFAKFLNKDSFLNDYAALKNYYVEFQKLPGVEKYLQGPNHKLPINNKMAAFGI